MTRHSSSRLLLTPVLAAAALACTASVADAAAPSVTTGGAAVTPTTATFTGSVNPRGKSTTYRFEYGTTSALGARTAALRAGAGTRPVTAAAGVAGLAANTVYHYRLVAHNADGTTRGARRTVRTQRAPLGLTLGAAPNPVPFGTAATLGGVLTGTGNAGRHVQIFQNPFPFTAGFTPIGAPVTTTAAGTFALPIGPLPVTTQFQARLASGSGPVSAVLTVPVAVRIATYVTVGRRHSDGIREVSFSGRIRPARDGAQFAVQKRSGDRWVTVAGGITRHKDSSSSRFAERVRVRHSGTYRVYVRVVDGNLTSATGREASIRLRPVR
jgi:hypothetical protein